MKKYLGEPYLDEHQLKRTFKQEDFVFVCDMNDLFGEWVPKQMIQKIIDYISTSKATFLLLTKNPKRYLEFNLPKNCVAGATIETDKEYFTGYAPNRLDRIKTMQELQHPRKMVSIEPIMTPSHDFAKSIIKIKPEFIAVGYDNYKNKLVEPDLTLTEYMIFEFEASGIKVYRKTLRKPNND